MQAFLNLGAQNRAERVGEPKGTLSTQLQSMDAASPSDFSFLAAFAQDQVGNQLSTKS